jgi:F-type H+-transporting ATPase subunit b
MLEIIPDPIHVGLLALPFLVAVAGAHFILWKPMLAYLEGREETVEKDVKEAAELEASAEQQLSTLEQRLAGARARVIDVHSEARGRAQAREAEILAAARTAAEQRVSEAVAAIATERKAAAAALESTATELSRDIASKVLGREVA